MRIVPFSPSSSTTAQVDAWYDLKRNLRLEILPDEPVFSKDTLVKRVESMKAIQESKRWCIWASEGSTMAGLAGIYRSTDGSEDEPVWLSIEVNPSFRRKGIGLALLKKLTEVASERGWESLQVRTCDRSRSGERFIEKTGAEKLLTSFTNRLAINNIDKHLLSRWLQLPPGNQSITIGEWSGFFPEERIQEISDFYQTVYEAGREQHGHSGFNFSPERVRKGEKIALTGNRKRHVVFATAKKTDRLLGLTEVSWSEPEPSVVSQGYTAVLPVARGRGIARRLKAEIILKLPDYNQKARWIRTGNAGNNHTILKINTELGFSRLLTATVWKVKTAEVVSKLHVNTGNCGLQPD